MAKRRVTIDQLKKDNRRFWKQHYSQTDSETLAPTPPKTEDRGVDVWWAFLLQWLLVNAVGFVVGNILVFLVRSWPAVPLLFLFSASAGAVFGTTLGIAQWLVLRRYISRAGWWILALGLGAILTNLIGNDLIVGYANGTVMGALTGAFTGGIIGVAQWLVLRREKIQAGWWILVTMIVGGVDTLMTLNSLVGYFVQVAIVAIEGIALVWLLRQPDKQVLPEAETASIGGVLWLRWLVASLLGWSVGLALGTPVAEITAMWVAAFGIPMQVAWSAAVSVWALMGGGVAAVAHWLAVRRWIKWFDGWLLAGSIGGVLGVTLGTALGLPLAFLIGGSEAWGVGVMALVGTVGGGVSGAVHGIALSIVLRRRQVLLPGQRVWPSALGGALVGAAVGIVLAPLDWSALMEWRL